MKKISLLALTFCFMSSNLLEAKFSLSSIVPGLGAIIRGCIPFSNALPRSATFVPTFEQLFKLAEITGDHTKLDMSKISVEHEPVLYPYNKEMVTVYADYKPELNAEARVEKARELRNWHAKVALGLALLSTAASKAVNPNLASGHYAGIVPLLRQGIPNIPSTAIGYLAGLNASFAGYKALQTYDLDSRIKAAQEGDGDMARALERKAIAYQVQDIE